MSVPKLRFPEFRYAEEWEEKSFYDLLLDVLDFRGRTPKKLGMDWGGGNIVSLSANNVKNGYIDFNAECNLGSEELYQKWMGGVKLEKGDIVFTMEAPLGNALLIPDSQKYILSQRVVVFKTKKEEVDNNFLIQLIWSDVFQNAIHLLSTGSTAKGINQKNLKAVNIEIPNLLEQKKIADCLTSIADRITAETQKLDTLKAHKKGLMQQLFPAEGETLPKLRFPEFQDSGEWDIKPLGSKAIKVGSGITPNGGEKNYKSEGRPFIRSQNIGWGCLLLDDVVFIDDVTHSTFSATEINDGDVFLNITGASIGRSAVADFRVKCGNVNQHVCIIRTEKFELNPFYLNQYLLSQYGQKQIDSFQSGGNRQGLNFAQIRSFSLPLPLIEEQQKIADCLTSIDEAIAAQSQAIELLKLHKKGLMQQLFPSVEEVKG